MAAIHSSYFLQKTAYNNGTYANKCLTYEIVSCKRVYKRDCPRCSFVYMSIVLLINCYIFHNGKSLSSGAYFYVSDAYNIWSFSHCIYFSPQSSRMHQIFVAVCLSLLLNQVRHLYFYFIWELRFCVRALCDCYRIGFVIEVSCNFLKPLKKEVKV